MVSLTVNGDTHSADVEHRMTLADFLRQKAGLTGTHLGCEHGVCGACTVLVDGLSMRSCLMLAQQARDRQVRTVESLASSGKLNALQQSFWEEHGLQCGFCTPGILMSLTELLRANPSPTEQDIRHVLSGHLCRCTGYQNIVKAAQSAAEKIRAGAA
jgi:aerobic-type carbon monoxide dehydrogenase small subunit (CoxS/CutS family)